jgi:ubiquinone/menaquinone biosynthesis C-methylase UbiE
MTISADNHLCRETMGGSALENRAAPLKEASMAKTREGEAMEYRMATQEPIHTRPPLTALPNKLFARLGAASPRLRRSLWRCWYNLLAGRYQQTEWTFMNYGYAPTDGAAAPLPLDSADEVNRYSIQLYHHLAGAVNIKGARVLEVGCGRGGGCSYLARYRQPASVLGIDFSERAIAFCNRVHAVPGLTFQQGDAEALPCRTGSMDIILNVESSHCYGSIPAFLAEVFRVLRPGGYFLWADIRREDRLEETRRQFEEAGFRRYEERMITPNVLRALELASERKRETIQRLVPRLLVPCVEDFAGVRGTRVYESLRGGAIQYPSCVLQRPPRRSKGAVTANGAWQGGALTDAGDGSAATRVGVR